MRVFLLMLFFTGIILIITNEMINAPKQVTVYKYLPRDLDTYLREEPLASVTFDDLFSTDFEPRDVYSTSLSNVGSVVTGTMTAATGAYGATPGVTGSTAAVSTLTTAPVRVSVPVKV